MDANKTVTANFVRQFTLTVTAGTGSGTYDIGAEAAIVATVPTGYRFDHWSGATGITNATSASTTVLMDANKKVTANFVQQFTLTVTAGTGSGTYDIGAEATIVATVPTGYRFDHWSGATGITNATSASTTVLMDANKTVTANFVQPFMLTYVADLNGTITGASPQTVDYGASGTAVTAMASIGYHFHEWSDNSRQNPRTDTNVTANINVTASFAINEYKLTYTADSNGIIAGSTPQTLNYGADGTAVTAVPNTGYHFVQWSDNSTQNPRTDTNVTANISATALFQGHTLYVAQGGTGDGTSWASALGSIQAAVNAASTSGGEVWVAMGSYGEQVTMAQGVDLYGGFMGNETFRDQRDYAANITTITASRYAVTGANSSMLDGFTVTNGGMKNLNVNTVISNCTFSANSLTGSPYNGAAMYNQSASVQVISCVFTNNSAYAPAYTAGMGGAVYNTTCSPYFLSCTFSGNSAYSYGGAIYNNSASPQMVDCLFASNRLLWSRSVGGNALCNAASSAPEFVNCVFWDNTAVSTQSAGGALLNVNSSSTLWQCTFYGNAAGSASHGGAIANTSSTAILVNTIAWGDTPDEIYSDTTSSANVTYSDIQDTAVYPGTGNLNEDPNFVDTASGDFQLLATSPCIDTGRVLPSPATADMLGVPRPQGANFDMGAYER